MLDNIFYNSKTAKRDTNSQISILTSCPLAGTQKCGITGISALFLLF